MIAPAFKVRAVASNTTHNSMNRPRTIERCMVVDGRTVPPRVILSMDEMVGIA